MYAGTRVHAHHVCCVHTLAHAHCYIYMYTHLHTRTTALCFSWPLRFRNSPLTCPRAVGPRLCHIFFICMTHRRLPLATELLHVFCSCFPPRCIPARLPPLLLLIYDPSIGVLCARAFHGPLPPPVTLFFIEHCACAKYS